MSSDENSQCDTDMVIKSSDLVCPICRELYVNPRSYTCGHTLCEICMIEMDKVDAQKCNTHQAPIHTCPICRETTVRSWSQRPINITLQNIVSTHKDYPKRLEELKKCQDTTVSITLNDDVDISKLAYEKRKKMAERIYEGILPVIYEAAMEGEGYVCIKEPNIVSGIEKTIDVLSGMLFRQNNVYRVQVTRQECTIHLIKNANWKRDFRNNSYNNPDPDNIDTDEGIPNGLLRRIFPVSPLMYSHPTPPPNL